MSVIIGRAIPDIRDGLKPVHRRILYSAYEQGPRPDEQSLPEERRASSATCSPSTTRTATCPSTTRMVRLAQEFSMRYPLVDGQGNYGSIDGDRAAAYRYTEARLAKIAMPDLLAGHRQRASVDFAPNFDDSRTEPTVLPARFPNLLVNGSGGIAAVGMATNIPGRTTSKRSSRRRSRSHSEPGRRRSSTTSDALRARPRFARRRRSIYGRSGIEGVAAHRARHHRSSRARMTVEKVAGKGEREQIVVTEIPYQVNKARTHAAHRRASFARRSSKGSRKSATRAAARGSASSSR